MRVFFVILCSWRQTFLLYNADLVPVGDDQRQHLELCRDLAGKFNQKYSETFTIPKPYVAKTGARYHVLADRVRKMSKSDNNESGPHYMSDVNRLKSRKDSGTAGYRFGKRNKILTRKLRSFNLLTIHSALSGNSIENLESSFSGKDMVS